MAEKAPMASARTAGDFTHIDEGLNPGETGLRLRGSSDDLRSSFGLAPVDIASNDVRVRQALDTRFGLRSEK